MIYTNDMLHKMHYMKSYNKIYSDYLIAMSNIFTNDQLDQLGKGIKCNALLNRSYRLNDCLNYWEWDKYKINKILDLQKVERCKDNNLCPNCRILNVSKDLLAMKKFYEINVDKYDFYLLTLTVPNIYPDFDNFKNHENDIKFAIRFNDHVDKLYSTFKKFTLKYCSKLESKHAFHNRAFDIIGGIRTLEITYSKARSGLKTNRYGFHPHLHCMIYIDKNSLPSEDIEKKYKGKWSDIRLREYCDLHNIKYDKLHITEKQKIIKMNNLYNFKSYLDIEIGTVWSMLWHGLQIKDADIDKTSYYADKRFLWQDGQETDIKALEVDIRQIQDEKGIYEAIKYTFKMIEFKNFFEFSQIVFVLHNRRLRQKFGDLYNKNLDKLLDNKTEPLELTIQEVADKLYLREMSDIFEYDEYEKISRFKPKIDKTLVDLL